MKDSAIPDIMKGNSAYEEIYAFYRAGILTGGEDHSFRPQSTIQRCEAASILVRVLHPELRLSLTLKVPELPALPGRDAAVTAENILALLDNLDPDGAFILRSAQTGEMVTATGPYGDYSAVDFMIYWAVPIMYNGELVQPALVEEIQLAVHEECHKIMTDPTFRSEPIYIGNGEFITVPHTKIFDSREATATIPESLRAYRFDTYVGEYGGSAYASQYGAYGLLQEFAAYCWGINNDAKLADYKAHYAEWRFSRPTNEYLAYAEFRYYILQYMLYAKEHYPDVYQGILDNDNFRLAFTTIDTISSKAVQELFDAVDYLRGDQTVDPEVRLKMHDDHTKIYDYDTYVKIMAEMEKPEYQQMLALLKP